MIIDVEQEMIVSLGYTVITAKSGEEAIRIFEADFKGIDLVILDMIMPDMSGGAVYDRLKVIDPGIKVVLSSGYSINGQAVEIMNRGCNGFIQKPFNMETLSSGIRKVLD